VAAADGRGPAGRRARRWGRALAAALWVGSVFALPPAASAGDGDATGGPAWFRAASDGRRVNLEWRAGPGRREAGFNVLRAARAGGPYAPVNPWLIPARGQGRTGYAFSDLAVERLAEYYYVLEAVDAGGRRVRRGPLRVRVEPGAGAAWGDPAPAAGAPAARGGCRAGTGGAPDAVLAGMALLALPALAARHRRGGRVP
jgi:hypothetical protein